MNNSNNILPTLNELTKDKTNLEYDGISATLKGGLVYGCKTCNFKMTTNTMPQGSYTWCYKCFQQWETNGRTSIKAVNKINSFTNYKTAKPKQHTTINYDIDDFIDD